ncbi:aromatic amino acid ammonia-lyase [Rhizobium sp. Pop5]|uniref:HAL/PAL/TAL family ammonia-lyase n=1 Tax=Rhizobium sp. Pop5 TaxID=1223565 RepID=UPI0002838FDD|nr:aromatic amino acid ammonia-lyase [Rhizobium sp. Pop5]EJZ18056.1 histidine ammonia-lyase [Rhizobium sp. Pop5]UVD55222.1 aromatic amino acid ammonia-lyase [Rhizobium sp. Pop5]
MSILSNRHPRTIREVVLGDKDPAIEEFIAVARYSAKVSFSSAYEERVRKSRRLVERFLSENRLVYGVTTGFGDNVRHVIPPEDAGRLQVNIVRSHAVSVGEPLNREQVRAIQLMILVSLGKGYSGVRLELLELIAGLLNNEVVPFAPGEGSVGYLAVEGHLALVLLGEGQARVNGGELVDGATALKQVGLKPIDLQCKEGLAMLNGTTSVTAISILALYNALQSVEVADLAAAMSLEALRGTIRAYDARYHAVKAHKGQAESAGRIRAILHDSRLAADNIDYRLQDAYSLRAVPQVHGASRTFIDYARHSIENEIGSSGDNPVIYPLGDDDGIAISGANFDGSYIGLSADTLCNALTNLAKISERRTDRMVNSHFSELPAFLVRNPGLNSGYMIVQYTAAGLLGEMKALSFPSTVDSVSTCGNQEDPVSFAYNAAVKAYKVSQKLESVLAIELLVACQALDFLEVTKASSVTKAVYDLVRSRVPVAAEDRAFYPDIVSVTEQLGNGEVLAILASRLKASDKTVR